MFWLSNNKLFFVLICYSICYLLKPEQNEAFDQLCVPVFYAHVFNRLWQSSLSECSSFTVYIVSYGGSFARSLNQISTQYSM